MDMAYAAPFLCGLGSGTGQRAGIAPSEAMVNRLLVVLLCM
jgi:hypothetical protein